MGKKFTPESIVVRTALDEHGSLLDVPRIAGEDLISYSERLFDAYANRSSSTYTGLLNGINRELDIDRKDTIEVRIKSLGLGDITSGSIILSSTTITNTSSFTNTINGTTVIAVGTVLTDPSQLWIPSHLRGYILKIAGNEYVVTDNTETELTIKETLSGLIGEIYIVEVDWELNSLVGLGLKIGNKLFKIIENTETVIKIESGDLFEGDSLVYQIRAFNPKVEVTGSFFNLYKEFSNSENFQLEKGIDLREDVRFHRDIVDMINQLSFFEATNLLDLKNDVFAFSLNRQSSEGIVIKETVPTSKFFKLENDTLKEGSVRFAEANIFLREVEEDAVSQAFGNYNVDYDQGIIKVNTIPSGNKTVSYSWNDFPFTVRDSPVIINPFNEEDSKEFLFLQQEMKRYLSTSDRFRSSVPKADMIEYIAELLAIKPDSWGE